MGSMNGMIGKELINKPVAYFGKIGVITDLFSNESGTEAHVRFRSCESILRSVGKTDEELVPLDERVVVAISYEEFMADVEKKKSLVNSFLDGLLERGLTRFSEHIGEFVTTAFDVPDREPFMLQFKRDNRLLIESGVGELKLVFHPRLHKSIEREIAIELAKEFYPKAKEKMIQRMNEFGERYGQWLVANSSPPSLPRSQCL
jgi:hypothetical protein